MSDTDFIYIMLAFVALSLVCGSNRNRIIRRIDMLEERLDKQNKKDS